jgi:hypothetical protein
MNEVVRVEGHELKRMTSAMFAGLSHLNTTKFISSSCHLYLSWTNDDYQWDLPCDARLN